MNKRKFTRKKTKHEGVLTPIQGLKYLFVSGKHSAKFPNHMSVEVLVKHGLIERNGSELTITRAGIKFVREKFPNLVLHESLLWMGA